MIGRNDNTPDGSDRVDRDSTVTDRGAGRHADASGTHTGADVHDRMTGTDRHRDGDRDRDRDRDGDRDRDRYQGVEHRTVPERLKPAKTSAAATFGLVFGLAALFTALTAILAPAAVLFGLIGIILSVVGMKMAKRLGVTGKGVAVGGLITSILGLLLGAAVLAGAAAVVNDEQQLDRLQNWIEDARDDLPSTQDLRDELPS